MGEYLKHNFQQGDVLNALELNQMDDSIAELNGDLANMGFVIETNTRRINYLEMLTKGKLWNWEEQAVDGVSATVPQGAYAGHIKSLGGRSVVVNQTFKITSEADAQGVVGSSYGITATRVDDYTFMLNGTAQGNGYISLTASSRPLLTAGHKYMFRCKGAKSVVFEGGTYPFESVVLTASRSGVYNYVVGIAFNSGDVYNNAIFKPELFDLTATGIADNGVDVDTFNAMYPDYYSYCEPTVVSATVDKVVSKGVNLLNPSLLVNGYYNATGAWRNDNTLLGTKELVDVKPNTKYYAVANGNNLYATLWDYNKTFLRGVTLTPTVNSFTTRSDERFIAFNTSSSYGVEWKNDVSFSTKNEYVAYFENELPIPESVLALGGYGLGVNGVYNMVDIENGVYIKRVVKFVVDGSKALGFTVTSTGFNAVSYKPDSNIKPSTTNIICSAGYKAIATTPTESNCIRVINGNNGYIYDNNYISLNDAKTKLDANPIEVVCELAEPVITPLSDLLSEDDIKTLKESFDVEGNGTITFHTAGDVQIPCRANIEYAVKVEEAI